MKGRLRVSAAEGVRAAVLANAGIAIASEWMFAPEIADGTVKVVLTGLGIAADRSLGGIPGRANSDHQSTYIHSVRPRDDAPPVGNPAIAARIVRIEVSASLYVPFHVALFERHDDAEAVLAYDRPSSFLGQFEHTDLKEIGLILDAKIDAVAQRVRGDLAR